ncbi:hypothetical protein N7491_000245 [Penicillium cf. griseofulvum]|uniref:Uncharacterized protein n=1 Tax=Penicillium cf. griseofulvum TaxID=2972120 RepID=A0A9W9ME80_9EURO|nr:hypothetical protein N7472_004399 [Penicillium cf. griseofulvum]KAJ5451063.1 hypothetical protein N7491_000245 [Penicillium cf. griseofulvum]
MVPRFQELAVDEGWMLFLPSAQQADHADGVACTALPAPGRSYNALHSQELADCRKMAWSAC